MVECDLPKVDAAGSSPVVRCFLLQYSCLSLASVRKQVCYICGLLFGLFHKPPALRLSMARSSPRFPLRVPSSAVFFCNILASHSHLYANKFATSAVYCSVCLQTASTPALYGSFLAKISVASPVVRCFLLQFSCLSLASVRKTSIPSLQNKNHQLIYAHQCFAFLIIFYYSYKKLC